MKYGLIIFFTFITFQSFAQNFDKLPTEFGKRSFEHVNKLCEFGTRTPGSAAEEKTIEYLNEQFSDIGMTVKIDPFYFTWVNLENRRIILNGNDIPIRTCYVNRTYEDTIKLSAPCYIINSLPPPAWELKDKIVLSNRSNHVILLKEYSPMAVIVVNDDDLLTLTPNHNNIVEVQIPAVRESEQSRSYNLIASYNNSAEGRKDIILTAHWDSHDGPGADDNASGTSVLIELARYFLPYAETMNYNLIFVATGAEEAGLIGSKSYVMEYSDELKNCVLNINIDGVGSGRKPYIEMKNPLKFNDDDMSPGLELISTDNFQSSLFTSFLEVYRNSSSPGIYPKWLKKNIKSAMKELGYRYSRASCCSGADHRSFAYMDIPVVFLDIISRKEKKLQHTGNDIPTPEFVNNLEKAGKIVSKIIINTNGDRELLK